MTFVRALTGNTRNHGKFFPSSGNATFVTGKPDLGDPEIFSLKWVTFAPSGQRLPCIEPALA